MLIYFVSLFAASRCCEGRSGLKMLFRNSMLQNYNKKQSKSQSKRPNPQFSKESVLKINRLTFRKSTKSQGGECENQCRKGFMRHSRSAVWVFFLMEVRCLATVLSRRPMMSAVSFRRKEKKDKTQAFTSGSLRSG